MKRVICSSSDDTYFAPNGMEVYSITDPFGGEIAYSPKTFKKGQEGQAVKFWFQKSREYPTCTAISCLREQGDAIHEWVLNNEDTVREWAETYDCPYKTDWLIDSCKAPCRQSDKYPDQVHPFSLG